MATTIQLRADAAFGKSGQYIARITGRDTKFTFARDFIGRKGGKRGDVSEAIVDEPGLYVTVDIDKKGNKDEHYCLVFAVPSGELYRMPETNEEAMVIARRLDAGETPSRIGLFELIEILRKNNIDAADKDPEEVVDLAAIKSATVAMWCEVAHFPRGKARRASIAAGRRRAMVLLAGGSEEEASELHPEPHGPPASPDPSAERERIAGEIAAAEGRLAGLRFRAAELAA